MANHVKPSARQVALGAWCSRWAILLLAAGLAMAYASSAAAQANDEGGVNAAMASDGRTFTVSAPGLAGFRAGFAATIEIDGELQMFSSAASMEVSVAKGWTEATPYGSSEITLAIAHFDDPQIDLILRLGQVSGMSGVLLQAGIRNAGDSIVKLVSVTAASMEDAGVIGRVEHVGWGIQPAGKPEDWVITGLNASRPAVTSLNELRAPLEVHEYGGFYRHDGSGFLFGPVGTPVAYVDARFAPGSDGNVLLNLSAAMSGACVQPGETRWGQQVLLLMVPPRPALVQWAEWVAKTHGARTSKGALSGWSDGNLLGRRDPTNELNDMVDAVLKSGGRLRPDVIQIEDLGRLALNSPSLAFCERRVGETGARFGLCLALNRKMDPSEPGTPAAITDTVRRAVQNGFSYLKIKYTLGGTRAAGEKRTSFEICRDDWAAIRKAAGEGTYLVSSAEMPNRAVVGIADASRTGADSTRATVRSAMEDALCSYQLNDRWFAVDNDAYFIGTDIANVRDVAGGWPLVRTWLSMVGLSCGTAVTSDPCHWKSFRPYWRNVEVLTPPTRERTEVLDLCTAREWPRLVGHVRREWGNSTVVLLWNPGATERAITLDFAQADMDPQRRYAVWSFWDDRYLGVAKGLWTSPALAPGASQHLCFTDLDRAPNKPVLIGSSLHIFCGAAEVSRITSLQAAMEIELADAGARDGDLFIYSRQRPVLRAATGCAVTGIGSAGENVWRIGIQKRQHGAAQRVELGILLPVTRQAWFWMLIVVAGASLLSAAWRYVAGQRLARQHALAEERARIARDLHDDLGTSLTRISVMADSAPPDQRDPARLQGDLAAIRTMVHDMTRSMDEIVWAINPHNDMLENMVVYLSSHAEEFLAPTGLSLRLDVPLQLPDWPLTAVVRHNVFLAFKEALNNIVKHAAAHRVQVKLVIESRRFRLVVRDDGRGYSADPSQASSGNGLVNMRNRMTKIGGTCRVTSVPGQGTAVEFSVPVSPAVTRGGHET